MWRIWRMSGCQDPYSVPMQPMPLNLRAADMICSKWTLTETSDERSSFLAPGQGAVISEDNGISLNSSQGKS